MLFIVLNAASFIPPDQLRPATYDGPFGSQLKKVDEFTPVPLPKITSNTQESAIYAQKSFAANFNKWFEWTASFKRKYNIEFNDLSFDRGFGHAAAAICKFYALHSINQKAYAKNVITFIAAMDQINEAGSGKLKSLPVETYSYEKSREIPLDSNSSFREKSAQVKDNWKVFDKTIDLDDFYNDFFNIYYFGNRGGAFLLWYTDERHNYQASAHYELFNNLGVKNTDSYLDRGFTFSQMTKEYLQKNRIPSSSIDNIAREFAKRTFYFDPALILIFMKNILWLDTRGDFESRGLKTFEEVKHFRPSIHRNLEIDLEMIDESEYDERNFKEPLRYDFSAKAKSTQKALTLVYRR